MVVISITNIKGGVGKTTLAINLSACLAKNNERVLLIDNDSQASVTQILLPDEVDNFEKTLYDVYIDKYTDLTDCLYQYNDNLFICPNEITSSKLDRQLLHTYNKELVLKKKIEKLPEDFFSVVIIDNSPALGIQLENSLCSSNYYMVVVDNSASALQGLQMIKETVEELTNANLTDVKLGGILRNRFDKRANFTKAFNNVLVENFKSEVFETIIHDSVRYKESFAANMTIKDYNDTYAEPYNNLIIEMKKRMKGI